MCEGEKDNGSEKEGDGRQPVAVIGFVPESWLLEETVRCSCVTKKTVPETPVALLICTLLCVIEHAHILPRGVQRNGRIEPRYHD